MILYQHVSIISELIDHAEQDRQRRLCQNLIRRRHKYFSDNISFDKKFEFKEKVKEQSHESLDIGMSTTDTSSNTGYTKYVAEKKQKVNRQPIAEHTVQKSGESLLKDFDGLQFSEESMDEFAEVVMLDFAGQYEFYATHQTFLNKHAIYLLVLDISKDLKGSLTSEDLDDTLTDLAEIPLEHIGGRFMYNKITVSIRETSFLLNSLYIFGLFYVFSHCNHTDIHRTMHRSYININNIIGENKNQGCQIISNSDLRLN